MNDKYKRAIAIVVTGATLMAYGVSKSDVFKKAENGHASQYATSADIEPKSDDKRVVYTVKQGDTLSKIGTQYGVSWQYIAQVNGISNPSKLEIGCELIIPSKSEKTSGGLERKVTHREGSTKPTQRITPVVTSPKEDIKYQPTPTPQQRATPTPTPTPQQTLEDTLLGYYHEGTERNMLENDLVDGLSFYRLYKGKSLYSIIASENGSENLFNFVDSNGNSLRMEKVSNSQETNGAYVLFKRQLKKSGKIDLPERMDALRTNVYDNQLGSSLKFDEKRMHSTKSAGSVLLVAGGSIEDFIERRKTIRQALDESNIDTIRSYVFGGSKGKVTISVKPLPIKSMALSGGDGSTGSSPGGGDPDPGNDGRDGDDGNNENGDETS